MGSPLPPDPYLALGVASDATAAQIKTVYRKLVLRCHPDKVLDPGKKQAAVDDFHKIQTAYEIVGDEQRRQRYDAAVKLAGLRKAAMDDKLRRPAAREETYNRTYTSTADPPPRTYPTRERVYEERRPDHAYERRPSDSYGSDYPYDIPTRPTARKDDDRYERMSTSKRAPPKPERERSRYAKESAPRGKDKARKTEREIKREREEIKRDRERKYAPSVQSSAEDSGSDSANERYRSRMKDEGLQREREAFNFRLREEQGRRRRSHDDHLGEDERRAINAYYEKVRREEESIKVAREHMQRAASYQVPEDRDVSPTRSTKDKTEIVRDKYGRPVQIRRGTGKTKSSSKPKSAERSRSSREKDLPRTKAQEIVDDNVPRRPPFLNPSYSSPETIRIPDMRPVFDEKQRSSSMDQRRERESQGFVPPPIRRSETTPLPKTSSYTTTTRNTTAPIRSSGLRSTQSASAQPMPQQVPVYEARPESMAQALPKLNTSTRAAPAAFGSRNTSARNTPQASPTYEFAPDADFSSKYAKGSADDERYQTTSRRNNPFKTEVREPMDGQSRSRERYTRSPEPMPEPAHDHRESIRETLREDGRSASRKYAERPPLTPLQRGEVRTASYSYKPVAVDPESRPRPSRTESTRTSRNDRGLYYGEIRGTASAPNVKPVRYSPPEDDGVRYAREAPTEPARPSYTTTRRPSIRPSYSSRYDSHRTPVPA